MDEQPAILQTANENARAGSKVKGEMHLHRRPATCMFAAVK